MTPADRLREAATTKPEPWAGQRDASWYDRPNTRTDKAVHIGRADGWSRCGRSFLDDLATWDPKDVPPGLRCRSNGCRQAWPALAVADAILGPEATS